MARKTYMRYTKKKDTRPHNICVICKICHTCVKILGVICIQQLPKETESEDDMSF